MRYINVRLLLLLLTNFQTSGLHRTAMASVHFIIKSGVASLPQKAQDVNDLRWHLFDV